MISLTRPPIPSYLTPQLVQELTDKYIRDNNERVWDIPALKEDLLRITNNKCCYCECNVTQEAKYFEVEHFYPKEHYPTRVIDWFNLLPSCKRCNRAKWHYDVGLLPLIDPCVVNPKEHLSYYHLTLYGKDELGTRTVEKLNLNDPTRLLDVRYQLWKSLIL